MYLKFKKKRMPSVSKQDSSFAKLYLHLNRDGFEKEKKVGDLDVAVVDFVG